MKRDYAAACTRKRRERMRQQEAQNMADKSKRRKVKTDN